MANFWIKTKFWTRVVVFGVCALYVLIVLAVNWNVRVMGRVSLLFTEFDQPRVLVVVLFTALASLVGFWLIRTIFKALRQWRAIQEKSRTARLERDMADMKAKAGMLQTRDAATTAATPTGAFPVKPVDPDALD